MPVDLDGCLVSTRDSLQGRLSVGESRQRRALRYSLSASSRAGVGLESRVEWVSGSFLFLFWVPRGVVFSWHGVVVRLDAMLCGVSLPSLTILHSSAPGARCAS